MYLKSVLSDLLEVLKGKKLIGLNNKEKEYLKKGGGNWLRHELKKKLETNVLHYEKNTYKEYFVFTILRLKKKKSKIEYGKRLLNKLLKEEDFKLALDVVEVLLLYSVQIDKKNKYSELGRNLLQKINIEHKIISNYCEISEKVQPIDIKPVSLKTCFYFWFGRMRYFEKKGIDLIDISKEAISDLEKRPNSTNHIKHILLKSFVSTIYNKGSNELIYKYLSLEEKGTNNYLNTCCYNAIYYCYVKDYYKSVLICQDALNLAKTPSIIELLQIIEAWANLMIDSNFKFSKFLNDLSILNKQKSGVNASLVLLKIFYWLKHEDFGKIIDYKDALKVYARRYLSGRMLEMYKIVLKLIGSSFTAKFEPLESEPLGVDVEVVPFNDLLRKFQLLKE